MTKQDIPAKVMIVSVKSRPFGRSKSKTIGKKPLSRNAPRRALRIGFRSSEKRPRINTALEVIVSMTSRISSLFEQQVDELSNFDVVYHDSGLARRSNDQIPCFVLVFIFRSQAETP